MPYADALAARGSPKMTAPVPTDDHSAGNSYPAMGVAPEYVATYWVP